MDVGCEGRDSHTLTFVRYTCRGMLFTRTSFSVSRFPSIQLHMGMFSVLRGHIDQKQIPWDRMVGWLLHSSNELVSLCHMDALYDTREQMSAKELSTERGDILRQVTWIVN